MRRLADAALFALLVTAPLAGGGIRIEALWGLHALAALALVAALVVAKDRIEVPVLVGALLALAVSTAVQAVFLPAELVSVLSPEAADVWRFAGGSEAFSVSYEPAATWREVSKLVLYAAGALLAAMAAQRAGGAGPVARPLAVAGIASAGVALVHRALGIERFFGLIAPMAGRADRVLTTFVNPNHGAAFLVLASFAAVGLALEARTRQARAVFAAMGVGGVCVAVLLLSKSGLLALSVAAVALGVAGMRRAVFPRVVAARLAGAAVLIGVVLVAAVVVLRPTVAALEVTGGGRDLFGLSAKFSAVRDVAPLVADHPLTGIGRGAFVSVYPRYQTSPLQLTFYFPESFPAQLVAEWGVGLGSFVFVAVLVLVGFRLGSARRPLDIALAAGLLGVLVHELFDFSLEMPGMALFVVALLAAGAPPGAGRRTFSRGVVAGTAVGLLGVSAAVLGVAAHGTLEDDLRRLDEVRASTRAGSVGDLEDVALRHPASALVATRLASIFEARTPPDFARAIRHANRALFLAPRYADAHLLTGRLLLRAGNRRQAFEVFRQAWKLSSARRDAYLDHFVTLADQPSELVVAVPRRDPVTDRPDGEELARLVLRLVHTGRRAWARAVLDAAPPVRDLTTEELRRLGVAAIAAGTASVAERLLAGHLRRRPEDDETRVRLARLFLSGGDPEGAARTIDGLGAAAADLRVRIALGREDWPAARAALEQLRRTRRFGVERLARLAVEVEVRAGQVEPAVQVLDAALAKRPGALGLRMMRAGLLVRLGRRAAARLDVAFVLQREPGHAAARRLEARLSRPERVR